ncbi:hypothetical protein HMN09_00493600 [Mycena chlorophos]|uniref:DUF7730 domain-containing protein n=1 Tax=Mycena chlorophos TaxID=658473 RepID=A0A8H6WC81_MYCCL|nr:hypothetical protein HMN09_00493600 [Mycena chlorophos]
MSESISQRALRVLQLVLIFTLCGPCILCQSVRRTRRHGCVVKPLPLVYPPPLPTKRVDISKTPPATPAEDCHILNLPQELRLMILENVLAGRILQLRPIPIGSSTKPCRIGAGGYTKDPSDSDASLARVRHLGIDVVHTCRHLYLEGLPILHRKNTYAFDISDFPRLFLGGLGMYCISDIRHLSLSLQLDDIHDEKDSERVVELLHMMRLETLQLNFELLFRFDEVLNFLSLDGAWAPRILAIRGLRAFKVKFPERPKALEHDPWETEQRQLATQLVAEYCALMVGPQSQEKYLAFLKDRAKHGAVLA